ncbi:unnamed protein product [Sympodiomycopsis kandeliae]
MPPKQSSARASNGRAGTKRKATNSKPSARYQRILEDENYEAHIQSTYSPVTNSSASTRTLPLEEQKRMEEDDFKWPTLHSMALELTAVHFLTHVLPTREAFDQQIKGKGKGKAPSSRSSSTVSRSRVSRVVSRGIGGRPILDEETAAGDDFVPSGADSGSEGSADSDIGIAASRSSKRIKSSKQSASNDKARSNSKLLTEQEAKEQYEENSQMLKLLPPLTKIKLLRLLRKHHPEALTRLVLVTYFLRGLPEIELDSAMTLFVEQPEEINRVLRMVGPSSEAQLSTSASVLSVPIRRLNLSGLTRLSPTALVACFGRCRHLEEVVLKGCVRVNAECMSALLEHNAQHLQVINVNFTDIGPEGLEMLISRAPNLKVLKVANVTGLTDKVMPDIIMRASQVGQSADQPYIPLFKLETLKIRGTQMGDVSLTALFGLIRRGQTPLRLTNLDVSHMDLTGHKMDSLLSLWEHKKMEEMISVRGSGFDEAFRELPVFAKLNLSHTGQGSLFRSSLDARSAILDVSFRTRKLILDGHGENLDLDFEIQREIWSTCEGWKNSEWDPPIERISLSELDPKCDLDTALWYALNTTTTERYVGDILYYWWLVYAKDINFSSNDLSKMKAKEQECLQIYEEFQQGRETGHVLEAATWFVENLDLSNTRIDDDVLRMFVKSCHWLQEINLSNTNVTSEGVRHLIAECPYLTSIDLTGCRGVPVKERRNVFEYLAG